MNRDIYNVYAMAADPQCSAAIRQDARDKLEIGDEEEYMRLKKLADWIDEVAGRYKSSRLIQLADEYDKKYYSMHHKFPRKRP